MASTKFSTTAVNMKAVKKTKSKTTRADKRPVPVSQPHPSSSTTTTGRPASQGRLANSGLSVIPKSQLHGTNLPSSSLLFGLDDPLSRVRPDSPASTARVLNTLTTSQQARRMFSSATKSGLLRAEQSRAFRKKVEQAIRERKVFSVLGCFPVIRRSLLRRGWIEKKHNSVTTSTLYSASLILNSIRDCDFDGESDIAWINRVLRDYVPDFIWTFRRDNISWNTLSPHQLVNRYTKVYFTSKVGIAGCAQTLHWFTEARIAHTNFPRCYRLSLEEEKATFIGDYRLTACMNLLKWLIVCYERSGESGILDPNGMVSSLCVDFAVQQIDLYVRVRRHEDLDWATKPARISSDTWATFLYQCRLLIYGGAKLMPDSANAQRMYELAKLSLQKIAPFWPQLNIDGAGNIWICKPGALSRGTGIVLHNSLEEILNLQAPNTNVASWVVQKYIERPMLIYKTKFDIRQWFLVTDWSPLTVWFYKESYVRFCSKPFSIDDFHESVHLCNNAVQHRYTNSEARDQALPEQNMWDNYTFQAYLKTVGKEDLWESRIYPGMKQGILGILLSFQEYADFRKNSFELYGADFMLSDDLVPWLIEINSSPCMASTTKVTARMCAQCQEDCIKVVVDRRRDRNASTGLFELIYQQSESPMPMNPVGTTATDTVIYGRPLQTDIHDNISVRTRSNRRRRHRKQAGSPRLTASSTLRLIADPTEVPFAHLVRRLKLVEPRKKLPSSSGLAMSTASIP